MKKYLIVTYNNTTKEYHNFIEYDFKLDDYNKECNIELYTDEIIINIIELKGE